MKTNTIKIETKNEKAIVKSSNKIGRPIGFAVSFIRKNELDVTEGTKPRYQAPLFFKVKHGSEEFFVGPDLFYINLGDKWALYHIKAGFDSSGMNTTYDIIEYSEATDDDIKMDIKAEIEIPTNIPIRTQFLTRPSDKCPFDMVIDKNGDVKIRKRWKY